MLKVEEAQAMEVTAHECRDWISAVAREWYALEPGEFPDSPQLPAEYVASTLYDVFMASERLSLEDGAARILLGFDLLRAGHHGLAYGERKAMAQHFFQHALLGNAEHAHDWNCALFADFATEEQDG